MLLASVKRVELLEVLIFRLNFRVSLRNLDQCALRYSKRLHFFYHIFHREIEVLFWKAQCILLLKKISLATWEATSHLLLLLHQAGIVFSQSSTHHSLLLISKRNISRDLRLFKGIRLVRRRCLALNFFGIAYSVLRCPGRPGHAHRESIYTLEFLKIKKPLDILGVVSLAFCLL